MVAWHTGATISAVQTPTRAGIIFTRWASEALQEQRWTELVTNDYYDCLKRKSIARLYSQVDICRWNHVVCCLQRHTFHRSCRVALYSRQTPYHNVDLENRNITYVSIFASFFLTLYSAGCCRVLIGTCVTGAAFTSVAVGQLNAVVGPSGITGVWQALVDVSLAAFTHVARQTHTLVTSNAVHTFAIVEAFGLIRQWVSEGGAIIQINLTVDTFKRTWAEETY